MAQLVNPELNHEGKDFDEYIENLKIEDCCYLPVKGNREKEGKDGIKEDQKLPNAIAAK